MVAVASSPAPRARVAVELNDVEVVLTRGLIATHCIQAAVGLVSVSMALLIPSPFQGLGGFAYMVLPIIHPLHGRMQGKREQAALARMEADAGEVQAPGPNAAATPEDVTAAAPEDAT